MNKRLTLLFFFLVTVCLTPSEAKAAPEASDTIDSIIDHSHHQFKTEGPIDLSGQWEFYYNQLLTPKDLETNRHPDFITVPGSWNRQGNFAALGVATYRMRLLLPEGESDLSLTFPIVNASAKIWVNGDLEEEAGVVSADRNLYKPKLASIIISLPEHIRTLEIVLQVANYSYTSGGIVSTPTIDKSSAVFAGMNKTNGVENFFAGSLVAMFLYQLILFFMFDRGKPYLWLSLICLGVALRALIVHGGSFLLPNLFPSVPWELWKKIEFGSVYSMVALFPLYVHYLFPEQAPRKAMFGFVGLAIALCSAVLVTTQPTYGLLLDVCHAGLLVAFGYAVYSVIKAWNQGSKDARVIFFGVLASFPFILLEILKNSFLFSLEIKFMYLVELGVLVFLLFQVYLLANHYAKSYRSLETSYQSLEKIVTVRTSELTTTNTIKNRLLSVMSHDVKSPLNSLRDILHLYNKGEIKEEQFQKYIQQLENDLVKTTVLVENVLFWTSRQLKGIQIKFERFEVHALVVENIELFETVASNKHIRLRHDMEKDLVIKSDRNILNFVLRNLLSNAIKFSHEGGSVEITVTQADEFLSVQIRDHGVGMDEQALQTLLSPGGNASTTGTVNEKGTGLGLALCREYLLKAGGELTVESAPDKGSTFSFLLPVA